MNIQIREKEERTKGLSLVDYCRNNVAEAEEVRRMKETLAELGIYRVRGWLTEAGIDIDSGGPDAV